MTTQYFSIVFYASPVWIGSLSSKAWTRLNSAHYRALRAVLKDFKKRKKRSVIDKESGRATPSQWGSYILASTSVKLYTASDTRIAKLLRETAYVNDRLPFRPKFIDRSRLKNRQASSSISDWTLVLQDLVWLGQYDLRWHIKNQA